ncbi:MAG: sulfotransferase family protein [Cyanobacteria bacterium P01_D01_bin.50]
MYKIIALWSHPRAISTAFLRMIMERGDFHVIYEPFCNFQALQRLELTDPEGKLVVIESPEALIEYIFYCAQIKPVFFKDTCEYRYIELLENPQFLSQIINTFIIRHPRKAIPSHYAVNPKVTLDEIGYEYQFEIFTKTRELGERQPVVFAGEDLIAQPSQVVQAYCNAVDIPFIAEALSWESGERQEWERTKKWHIDINKTKKIVNLEKSYSVNVDNNPELHRYYNYHLRFYNEMYGFRLQA